MENIMLTSGNEKLNQSSQLAGVLARLDNLERKAKESCHSMQGRGPPPAFKETSL